MKYERKDQAQALSGACAFLVSATVVLVVAVTGIVRPAPVWAQAALPSAPTAPAPAAPAPANPFVVPALPAPAAPPVAAPAAPALTGKIAQIAIKGNVNVSDAAIRARITQKVGDAYSPAAADRDRDAIKSMGYFNGDIGLTAAPDPAGGIDETYTVVENPVVKKIVFTANTPTGEPTIPAATLRKMMATQENQVLNTDTLVRDLDKLFNRQTGYASQQGYIIDVSSDINIDPVTGVLTIPLVETHILAIKVTGNKKTKTVVITRELHSKPGDVLDQKTLQRDLTHVYNLGLFDQVGPYEIEAPEVGKVVITIPVVEKRSGQVSVGVGYSSTEKLVGRAELAENNFRGMGERISLLWEVGGISSQSSLELNFSEPYLDKHHTSLDLDVYDKAVYRFASNTFGGGVGDNNTYTEKRKGGVISLTRPFSDTFYAGITMRSETVHTNDFTVPVQDQFIRQDGSVNALGLRAVSNTKDNDISPASGALRSFSVEGGFTDISNVSVPSEISPGRHSMTKVGMDLRQYISLQGARKPGDFKSPKKVFATRLLLGFANRDIPFFEQYFLGGADSLRGYDTDRFWGNNLLLFQAELRIPLGKSNNVQGVLLSDIGDAWGSLYQGQGLQQHDRLSLSSDFGVGVRLVTPLGPLRFDYAIGRDGGHTQFSIGQSF